LGGCCLADKEFDEVLLVGFCNLPKIAFRQKEYIPVTLKPETMLLIDIPVYIRPRLEN